MAEQIEYQLSVRAPETAVNLLHDATALPKTRIKDAMQKGAVWLKRDRRSVRLRRASRVLQAGDELALYYHSEVLAAVPPAPVLVADRDGYSVWDKPMGLMSSGSRFGDHHSIARYVEVHFERPTFLVHRLDRFTRGLMLLAHTKPMANQLAMQFRERTVKKVYQAEVRGELQAKLLLDTPLDGKSAVTHVTPRGTTNGVSRVEVCIETGRKHQIRRHLAEAGYPVIGDVAYGADQEPDLRLAAVSLTLHCPLANAAVSFELPLERRLFV